MSLIEYRDAGFKLFKRIREAAKKVFFSVVGPLRERERGEEVKA